MSEGGAMAPPSFAITCMRGSLIPSLALAVVDGHAIFLDCFADRYFALPPAENDAVVRLIGGEEIDALAERAITAAIGMPANVTGLRSLLVCASREVPAGQVPAARPLRRTCARAIGCYAGTKIRLSVGGLHAALEYLARLAPGENPPAGRQAAGVIERIAGAHNWLARQVTANDACLVRSLALATHLRVSQCEARLEIGVRVDPFAAHCWVTSGDRLVGEDTEIVAAFAPILIVR